VTTLEKRQRQFEDPSLDTLEFKFFSTLRLGTAHSELFLACCEVGLLFDDNPCAAFRTCDA
jgi:hypothetical protein